MNKHCNRIMIAGIGSGSGKTTLVCGILMALKMRNLKAASCKCGPDYIDPMFHSRIFDIPSINLDLFFTSPQVMNYLLCRNGEDRDITVIEGVMGFYDGLSMESDRASSYEVAKMSKTPVILTVCCKGMAYSVVPLIRGMIEFREDSNIKGIILNQVSDMTYHQLKPVIEQELGIPVLGHLPVLQEFVLESRHLGLVMPKERDNLSQELERLGKLIENNINIEEIIKIAAEAPELFCENPLEHHKIAPKCPETILGVAEDEAFCFYYRDNLKLLEELGCKLVKFSPLHDKKLPEQIQGILFGGGYPELHAQQLSRNLSMKQSIQNALKAGMPCMAECGGFQYLQKSLWVEGVEYPMADVIPSTSENTGKLVRFGYIHLKGSNVNPYLKAGEEIKAHEFHYFDSTDNGDTCLAVKPSGKRQWQCVYAGKNLFAGYPHLYFYSNIRFIQRFIKACQEWKV